MVQSAAVSRSQPAGVSAPAAGGSGYWTDEPAPRRGGVSPAVALRHTLLWTSRRPQIKTLITASAATRSLVHRFVAGDTVEQAVAVARALTSQGLHVTLDHLGEDTRDAAAASAAVTVYESLLRRLGDEGLAAHAEMSIKLSALGQALDQGMALENARRICATARAQNSCVTVDMEDHTTTDSTLQTVAALRKDFASTGAVIQASLHRSIADCQGLAVPGSRVRLCKGAYQEPATVAWQRTEEVRTAYLRCMRTLISGGAYLMAATHDPQLISAAGKLLAALAPDAAHEYQMLYGVRTDEQQRLARGGATVRVYVPFGTQWYSYLMRRMAERPANLALVLRALVSSR
jgi:proline dehydrogenase